MHVASTDVVRGGDDGAEGIVLTGGTDTQLGVFSFGRKSLRPTRRVLPFPQHPPISVLPLGEVEQGTCPPSSLVACRHAQTVQLWRVDLSTPPTPATHLIELETRGDHNVRCMAVDATSSFLAVSDVTSLRVYNMQLTQATARLWAR